MRNRHGVATRGGAAPRSLTSRASSYVLVLVRPQGCGRSTFIRELASRLVAAGCPAPACCKDPRAIRRVAAGQLVIIDGMNLTPDRRRQAVHFARRAGAAVTAVHFDTPAAVCAARLGAFSWNPNNRPAGQEAAIEADRAAVVATSIGQLVMPAEAEGFDSVMTVWNDCVDEEHQRVSTDEEHLIVHLLEGHELGQRARAGG